MNRGNSKKLRNEIVEVIDQLKNSRLTMTQLRKKYHISPETLKREILTVIPETEYINIAKAKLAQGNEPQRWMGGIRGSAARKYRSVGTISIRTRHRKYGLYKQKTRILKVPFIKIKDEGPRDECWARLANYNWIRANKQLVPAGFYVVSKNGDTMDCRPENLILSNRKTHILLNHRNFPGMCRRGYETLLLKKKRNPSIEMRRQQRRHNEISEKFECAECGQEYGIAPNRCIKCGSYSFERIVDRRKTG